ncbi:hypothetical protein ACFL3G_02945 [Planctomycetota bacterium]
MSKTSPAVIVTLCAEESIPVPIHLQECFWQVDSESQALEIMRMFHVDLLLVSLSVDDVDMWNLLQKVRTLTLSTKWALLCHDLTAEQELRARILGVMKIYYSLPDPADLFDLAISIRQKTNAAVECGTYKHSNLETSEQITKRTFSVLSSSKLGLTIGR